MSEMSENYKFTSESDFPLTTPLVRHPPKSMLGSGQVSDEKFGKKKEMLANAILILCVCALIKLFLPLGAATELLLAGWVSLIFI